MYGLSGTIQWLPLALAAIFLGTFTIIELNIATDPIIPLVVLRSRGVLVSCFAQLGFISARWTVLFFAPIYALAVRGLSPATAGAALIPTNVGFGLGGVLVGITHIRRAGSFWTACIVSLTCFAATLFALGLASGEDSPGWLYVSILLLNGLATGAALNYTLNHMLHLSVAREHFVATSLLGTFRGFAGSFGSAIGGGLFIRSLRGFLEEGFQRLDGRNDESRQELIWKLIGSPDIIWGPELDGGERKVAIEGYVAALRVLYGGAVVLAVAIIFVQAAAGRKPPSDQPASEREIRSAIASHDPELEA